MDKAMAYIDKLAAKLGVAAEHVYGVLVKQAVVNGVLSTLMMIAGIIVAVLLTKSFAKKSREHQKHIGEYDLNPYLIIQCCTGLALAVLCIAGLVNGSDMVGKIINPEYYAIKEILDTIGGK
ncbi:hypothetical protein [Bacillus sp. LLTC93]|uniref:hypothetical protein n=1 Tax=Bacillus sp. LLTC93 TaxID=2108274 RepID=UPI000D014FEB|nr:hypothetical protein [Bacillus sp. LLTC93]PRO41458.1 hypothetical protein C6W18_05450 [Bacillus sp. LLTC93]